MSSSSVGTVYLNRRTPVPMMHAPVTYTRAQALHAGLRAADMIGLVGKLYKEHCD